jgi:hypothetical protein
MKRIILFCTVSAIAVTVGCGTGEPPVDTDQPVEPDSVIVIPASPLEVGLEFSNLLGMNDPACFDLLAPDFRSTFHDSLSPWEAFGRWRAFDASGRLTEIYTDSTGTRTSYYCSIARLDELPAVVRIDFLLYDSRWTIEGLGEETPREVADSLTIELMAELILADPALRKEMRLARLLMDDCRIDSVLSYDSWHAASEAGASFPEYIIELLPESYSALAICNIRRSGKFQLIQDRATYRVTNVPLDLNSLVAAWREMAYLDKAILRSRHEAMQNLRLNEVWVEPDIEEELERLAGLRRFFYAVSDIVEERDTLSRTYAVLLTSGTEEPLITSEIELNPHLVEQRTENDIGIPVIRALGVEMNGDMDPERVVYSNGNLYLFQGTRTGYRLVWRTYDDFESDYHAEFGTEPSLMAGCREVSLIGNSGLFEYRLGYSPEGLPVFTRTAIASEEPDHTPGEVPDTGF